jgi:uncharacterized SAM-binding protein YcdF (DUF218 family)
LLAAFLFPPGIFILLFLAAAFYARRFRKTFLFATLLFYLLSTTYVGTKLIEPLENRYPALQHVPADVDAVVVLSGGNNLGAPNLPLMPGAFKRYMYGVMLAKKYNLPLVFSGGFHESDAAAVVTKELNEMLDLNLTVRYENRSLDTYENARYTEQMLHKAGIPHPRVLLVTSAFHMPRAKLLFDRTHLDTIPAPTDYLASSLQHFWYLPSITGLRLSYHALHEYLGYLIYSFKS